MRQSLLATAMMCGAAVCLSVSAYAQTPSTTPPEPSATAPTPPPVPPAPAMAAPAPPPAPPAPAPEAMPPPAPPAAETPPAAPPPEASPAPKPKPKMMMSGASNLGPSDTKSDIAPKLPAPKLGPDAGTAEYLAAAKKALAAKNTGEAQEALEMAETRALDRITPADQAGTPDSSPLVGNIHAALEALGKKDMKGATAAVDKAISGAPVTPMPPKMKSMKPMHSKMPGKPKSMAPPA